METVSQGSSLHENSVFIFWRKNRENVNLLSADFAYKVLNVEMQYFYCRL